MCRDGTTTWPRGPPGSRASAGDLVDFGSAVRDTIQIGDCGAEQRLRGYSVISAGDLDAALLVASRCPGLQDTGFGVEVGVVQEMPG
jgi:hypothetical protein